jgi:hypothetical protein
MMKKRLKLTALGAGALLLSTLGALAADTINMDAVSEVDRHGDGTIKITFRLSASQWSLWKQQYGDRPDVLWRDLREQFSMYALAHFDLEKNDVTRTATATLTGRAMTTVRADGSREVDMSGDFKLVSNTPREWVFTSTQQASPYSPILSQTAKVILPLEAQNARLSQPGTAFQKVIYDMPRGSIRPALLGSGVGLGVVGFLLIILGFVIPKKKPAVTAISADAPPPALQG